MYIGYWDQLVAQLCRPTPGGVQGPLLILLLIVFRASVHVPVPVAQYGIDDPSQLVGRGRDGLGRSQMGLLPAQEGAESTVGAVQCVGR